MSWPNLNHSNSILTCLFSKAVHITACILITLSNLTAQLEADCINAEANCDPYPTGDNWTLPSSGSANCGGTDLSNMLFYKFVAGFGPINVSALATACDPPTGETGVQMAIWATCPGGFVDPECLGLSECFTYPLGLGNIPLELDIPDGQLIPGRLYMISISGCNGAICDFDLDINGEHLVLPELDDNETTLAYDQCTAGVYPPNTFCEGARVRFYPENEVYDVVVAEYFWSITAMTSGTNEFTVQWQGNISNGIGNPIKNGSLAFQLFGTSEMYFTFTQEGVYEICLDEITNYCSYRTGPICQTVTILPQPDEERFGPYSLCYRDVEFLGWQGPNLPNLNGQTWKSGPFDIEDITEAEINDDDYFEITRLSDVDECGCAFEQTIEIDLVGSGPPGEVDLFLTDCQLPYNWFDIVIYDFEDNSGEEIVLVNGSAQENYLGARCDSFVTINLHEIEMPVFVQAEPCANQKQTFTFGIEEVEVLIDGDFEEISFQGLLYQWIDSTTNMAVTTLSDNPTACLQDGNYYVSVTGFMDDVNHNDSSQGTSPNSFVNCLFGPYEIINPVVPVPLLEPFDNTICPEDVSNIQFKITNLDPTAIYTWIVPASLNGQQTISADQSTLTISNIANLSASESFGIYATTDCGVSETNFFNVQLLPAINVTLLSPRKECINLPFNFTYPVGTNETYTFDFPGATVFGNTISYNSTGIYNYTINISNSDGCTISAGPFEIEVFEAPPLPIINCIDQNDPGDLLFTWDEEPGVDYTVTASSSNATAGIQNGNEFFFDDLGPFVTATVSVTATNNGPAACNTISNTLTCETDDCDLPAVDNVNFEDIEFCQDDFPNTFSFVINTPTGITGTFSGQGIDSQGNLDFTDFAFMTPNAFSIQYEYTDGFGCSEYLFIDITIRPQILIEPVIVSDLCIDDFFFLEPIVTGSSGGFYSYTWIPNGETTAGIELNTTTAGPQTVSLNITDEDGFCMAGLSFDYIVNAEPLILNTTSAMACNGTPGQFPVTIDLTQYQESSVSGSWFFNNTQVDDPQNFNCENFAPDIYTLIFTPSDPNIPCANPEYTFNIDVVDCNCPDYFLEAPIEACAALSSYPVGNNVPGTWTSNYDELIFINNSVLEIQAEAESGTYVLTFTPDAPLEECLTTIDIFLYPAPYALLESDISICNLDNGEETDIQLDTLLLDGGNGSWSFTDGSIQIDNNNIVSFIGVDPGEYELNYTVPANTACDAQTFTTFIRVRNCDCPEFYIENIAPLCNTNAAFDLNDFLYNPENLEGTWMINNQTVSNILDPSQYNEQTIEITFVLTTSQGMDCEESTSRSIDIFEPLEVILAVDQVQVCNNPEDTQFPSEIDLTDFNADPFGEWTVGPDYNNGIIDDITFVNFENIEPGEYTFIYTANNPPDSPCTLAQADLTVTVLDCTCPVIDLQAEELCNTMGVFNLSNLLSQESADGIWTVVDGPEEIIIGNGNFIDIENLMGEFIFQYTLNDMVLGCDLFQQTTLTITQPSDITVIESIKICNEDGNTSANCFDLSQMVTGATGEWTAPNNFNGDFSDLTNICLEGFTPGETLIFNFRTNNEFPCQDRFIDIEVEIINCCEDLAYEAVINPACIAENSGSIALENVSGGSGNFMFSLDDINFSGSPVFTDLFAGNYSLSILGDDNCELSIQLTVPETPSINAFIGDDLQIQISDELFTLEASSDLDLTLIENVMWTENGNTLCTGTTNNCLSIEVDPNGLNTYCVELTDSYGCSDLACINIEEVIPKRIYIPTIFTPDGPNNNTFFIGADSFVSGIESFNIYSRWGELVFSAPPSYEPNDATQGWDGTFNQKFVQQGVYVYAIAVRFNPNEDLEYYTGSITIIR